MNPPILPAPPTDSNGVTWRVAPFVRRIVAFLIDLVAVVLWGVVTIVVIALALVVRGLMRPNP